MTAVEYQRLVKYLDSRFLTIDQRFDRLERRVEEGFREVLGHFDELYRRIERLEQEYHAIVQALRRIEALLADEVQRREILERDLAVLKQQAVLLQARIEELERRLR
jgi:chromosome segregation ATPase